MVPGPVADLVDRLERAGFETWAVGGAVRDALRGESNEPADWDLATRATPREIRRLFRRTVPLGIEYGTVGVFGYDGTVYEVTTFRHDVISYGRKAVVAFAASLDEDLARRDFTINAIAWHPRRRVLHDPHGGLNDLGAGILRAVGNPAARFREDYLRVLRGLRFAGTLDMRIHPTTWAGVVGAVQGLAILSVERVSEELMKVLGSDRPSGALALYESSGAREVILPELHHGWDGAARAAIDAVRGCRAGGRRAAARLAMGLAIGMGPRPDPAGVTELLRRLRFSNAEVKRIGTAARGGLGPPSHIFDDPVARRRWLSRFGKQGLYDVSRMWFAALRTEVAPCSRADTCRVLSAMRNDLRAGLPLSIRALPIGGRDLLALGQAPGPGIGRTLRQTLEAVWRDPALNDRTRLLELAAAGDSTT